MANAREMYADLVCAAGSDQHLEQCIFCEAPQDTIFAPGVAPRQEPRRHTDSGVWIAGDGFLDPSLIGLHNPVHQGYINLADAASGELGSQAAMCGVVLGYKPDTAGVTLHALH